MKFALLNSVIMNGGDAGIVYGIRDAIREILPEAQLSIFARRARDAEAYYPDLRLLPMLQDTWPRQRTLAYGLRESFPLRSNLCLLIPGEKEFYKQLRSMDAIIYCGGGYINNLYSTGVLFRIIEDTLEMGIPHMAYAHSIGPFFDDRSRTAAAALLSRFDAVTTRDEASYRLLHEMGTNCKETHFTADAAFAMQIATDATMPLQDLEELKRIYAFKSHGGGAPLFFMSVREWGFPGSEESSSLKKNYRSELQRFILQVIAESNCRICFVSTCQGRKEYGYDDSRFAAELLKELQPFPEDRVYICGHPFAPSSYPLLIGRCADLVVSMRMHFIIFSIMGGVPFIAIAYEKKSQELARQVGLDGYCHELSNLKGDILYKNFIDLREHLVDSRATINSAFRILRERSQENARVLRSVIT
ncbi:Polysaccharide pyruvyl transferase family protein WcaK [Syntrophus gentianae]|uniref:Polysaccharide pyruvyl transferase family protein WcaK n=1 Tax=Syntrophus gentianae TaxID=43775 RepID=A0A1H7V717_9BACT|nr:Polysaccharide pyruvyl transferase family protein WcaK [Syntrophus gentianae]